MECYRQWGIPETVREEETTQLWLRLHAQISPSQYHLFPGVGRVLGRVHKMGLRTALMTTGQKEVLQKQLTHLRFPQLFELVKTGVRDKETALREILATLGVGSNEAIYVDDSTHGLASARRVEMASCGVTWRFAEEGEIKAFAPDEIARTPVELIAILKRRS